MAEQRLMKDGLDRNAVLRIATAVKKCDASFSEQAFIEASIDGLDPLELKDRVRHIIRILHDFLPSDFHKTARLLLNVKDQWDPGEPDDNLAGFAAWPLMDYIGEYGLENPGLALSVLEKLTPLFSGEFAIRPFFIQHSKLTLKTATQWTQHPDEHVRRLASEGCRPRLPWGQQLPAFINNPEPVLQILEKLKDDPSEYVRRSVANNLNDISKDHPDRILSLCSTWKKSASPEREWIIRHATRTLVKSGHPQVFGLLGFTKNPKIKLQALAITPSEIELGDAIFFEVELISESSQEQQVVIDYAIHHMKANGRTSPKVFKFKTLKLAPNAKTSLTKKHAIRPITTRTYYSGEHAVEILINGKTFGKTPFTLSLS